MKYKISDQFGYPTEYEFIAAIFYMGLLKKLSHLQNFEKRVQCFTTCDEVFGLIKCRIRSPRDFFSSIPGITNAPPKIPKYCSIRIKWLRLGHL